MALYVIFDTRNSYITQLHADDDEAARREVTEMLRHNQPVGFVQRLDTGPDGGDKAWVDVTAQVVDHDATVEAALAEGGES